MTATPENVIKIFTIGINFLQKHEWCQKSFALTRTGRKVPCSSKDAAIFCAQSSIEQGLRESGLTEDEINKALDIASNVFIEEFEYDFCVYNDREGMTKEGIIQAFIQIKNKYERIIRQNKPSSTLRGRR
jgi:hypothetical protein